MQNTFPRRKSREMIELNITSLLDMMSTILFFLLLSVSFMGMTSLTLPPSAKKTVKNPFAEKPLAPKVFAFPVTGGYLRIILAWQGKEPGEIVRDVPRVSSDQINNSLVTLMTKTVNQFLTKFPNESSIQMSLATDVNYQEMISIMDGIRAKISDIVLLSYEESRKKAQEKTRGRQ